MSKIDRDVWIRLAYTMVGGGSALLWNRLFSVDSKGNAFIPPSLIAIFILLREDSSSTDKDIAASILGYSSVAQAISYAKSVKPDQVEGFSNHEIAPRQNPLDKEAHKLNKIRAVTGTLGAIADIVGKFRGGSNG